MVYDIKSYFIQERPISTALPPMFFLFMPIGHIATTWDLGNAAEINDPNA